MTARKKIDSNTTGLRYVEEASLGVLPGSPDWKQLEPNSYADFGGQLTNVARNPINNTRQNQKGVVTDLDASGGFDSDITQTNFQDMLQGFLWSTTTNKGQAGNDGGTTQFSMTTGPDTLTRSAGSLDLTTRFMANDIVQLSGFVNAGNNDVYVVTSVTATTLQLTRTGSSGKTTVAEAGVSTAFVEVVGFNCPLATIGVDMTGSFPALTSASAVTLDFNDLGLSVGEFIWMGGDAAFTTFNTAANRGFVRIRSIAAQRIELDKTENTLVTEAAGGISPQLYFGRVLKNGTTRRSYQLERILGQPDDASSDEQAEYLVGAVPNRLNLNLPTGSKATAAPSFVAIDHETVTAGNLKAGTRPVLSGEDAWNTSSDVKRVKMAVHDDTNANPTALFAFSQNIELVLDNGVTPDKAVSVLGAFDVSSGNFTVTGNITAYFASVSAISAVRNNSDVTLDIAIVRNNSGMVIDLPLISLGDGRANVEQDRPITIPLNSNAATGSKIDTNLDHTMLFMFFQYLPTLAAG